MAYSHNAPFRADVVGSYLRPAELKAAREDFAAGKIDAAALKAVEDKAITELVAKQKAAGLHVITDGEFRRGWWHFDFMWGFNGVDHAAAAHRVAFHDEVTPADTATVTGSDLRREPSVRRTFQVRQAVRGREHRGPPDHALPRADPLRAHRQRGRLPV